MKKDKPIRVLSTKLLTWEQKSKLLHPSISLVEFPFIQINFIDFSWPSIIADIWIFTSSNAVEAVLNRISGYSQPLLKVWCVGENTKNKLQANNFEVEVHFNYANELNEYILENFENKKMIWFRGNITSGNLTRNFNSRIHWTEVFVYENQPNSTAIQVPYDAILFFSPSAVESFLQNNSLHDQVCFCIGETTQKKLSEKVPNTVILPKTPTVENVLLEVKKYYLLNP